MTKCFWVYYILTTASDYQVTNMTTYHWNCDSAMWQKWSFFAWSNILKSGEHPGDEVIDLGEKGFMRNACT